MLLERTSKQTPVTLCLSLQCHRAVSGLCGRSSSAAGEPGPPRALHPPHVCTLPVSCCSPCPSTASRQCCLLRGSLWEQQWDPGQCGCSWDRCDSMQGQTCPGVEHDSESSTGRGVQTSSWAWREERTLYVSLETMKGFGKGQQWYTEIILFGCSSALGRAAKMCPWPAAKLDFCRTLLSCELLC